MDAGVLQRSIFILFCLLFVSDTSIAEKPPSEAIWQSEKLPNEENDVIFSSSISASQLDAAPGTIPIVNPTTPTTTPTTPTTPSVNPTSPLPPANTQPVTNPTPPMVNPTSPLPPANTQPVTNPAPTNPTPGTSGGAWCTANPTASQTALQVALDYACGYGGTDCSAIQSGGVCFDPNTLKDHASYAFNDYYQKNPNPTSCVFGGVAQLTYTDPSYGNCHFASSTRTSTPPPTTTTPPTPTIPMTPPSVTTPVNPYAPSGPTGYGSEPTEYGSEPTGTPNSAEIASCTLQQLLVIYGPMLWVAAANFF